MRKYQHKSINCVINSTFRKVFSTRSQEIVGLGRMLVNVQFFQPEQTVAIRKRKFKKNKLSAMNNVVCQVFGVSAKKEPESCQLPSLIIDSRTQTVHNLFIYLFIKHDIVR